MAVHTTTRADSRIPELDGIRGIAILLVLACHFGYPICPFGWIGVDLFFVLSGFLITGILLGSLNSRQYFRRFYLRRAFRIFPVYYTFLIFFFHVGPLLARFHALSFLSRGPGQEIWYWLYLSNWSAFSTRNSNLNHFWSLCVEEQFYLLWPLVVRYSSRRTLIMICVCIVALSPLLRLAIFQAGMNPYRIYQETIFRLDGLALGALLALAGRDGSLREIVHRWSKPVAAFSTAAFGLLLWRFGPKYISEPMTVWGYTAASLFFAALVFNAGKFGRLLRLTWLRNAGRYSYAMYVLHVPIAGPLVKAVANLLERRGFGGTWVMYPICIVVGTVASYLLALISWHILEQPCARLRDRLFPAPPEERLIAASNSLLGTGAR